MRASRALRAVSISPITFFACAAFCVAPATARTVTVHFTGEVLYVFDLANQAPVPSAVGTAFSGYLTYNVSEPEYYENIINEYGQPSVRANADSGCGQLLNSVCQEDRGVNAPIVTDYRITWGAITYTPFSSTFGFYDGTQRYNQSVGGSPSGEHWLAARNQYRIDMTGNPTGAYQYTQIQRAVVIHPFTTAVLRSLLKKPASNLDQGFELDAVPTGQSNFTLNDGLSRVNCIYPTSCPDQFDPGSIQLSGTLKSVSFKGGKPQR